MPRKGERLPPTPLGDTSDPLSLAAYGERFLDHIKTRGFSEQTLQNRRLCLKYFIAFCDERAVRRPQDVSRSLIERYQRQVMRGRTKRTGRPVSAATQVGRLVPVKAFFAWLTKSNVVLLDPASQVELPRAPKKLPRHVLSQNEAEAVLSQPDIGTPRGLRDRALLEVLYSTGMRRSELIALRTDDVNTSRGVVLIREGKGMKDRIVPIGERALLFTAKYLDEARPELLRGDDDGTLFVSSRGGALGRNTVTGLCKRYLEKAGLEHKGACHVFRHTMATLMLEGGADVRFIQEMLGHVQLSTTEIYTKVSITKLKEVHERTHPARMQRHAVDE
jgi:integrase/recombinase XerD